MSLRALRPLLLVLSGLFGACGVGLAAAAAHVTGAGNLLGPASSIALTHAPALLGLYLAGDRIRTATLSGLVIGLGVLLFAGDLAVKQWTGQSLFPMAAPTGGIAMMVGWALLALGAFLLRS
ncbi:DUF423 domain-containing protein [Agrobacterium vitis]|uniref:DUF423 domain-containing protein n=1 Tax=Agrobacterium vitis TaxID=373 RepID=UPI00087316DE|nr:DUF423 domain-containing protein [Agrobacterium vitis]MCE6074100.1 DUF423 domain-containing protein [Agrobacterium vitis]MCM2453174.1 DUF423 domain-containing protein [Agrobacterium vitis]MCM2468930.1 DUF423 domain-containing protein [Agrobacterium vitis]MUO71303.1 DUF423 domain-containing protein [Agrobacterium vitis]MUO85060.1 DUF423 domain-containing protein [Agrobacterium vitis]